MMVTVVKTININLITIAAVAVAVHELVKKVKSSMHRTLSDAIMLVPKQQTGDAGQSQAIMCEYISGVFKLITNVESFTLL